MSRTGTLKALARELAKSHAYAAKAQTATVRKADQARVLYAKRGGNVAATVTEYEAPAFDESVAEQFDIDELRSRDAVEVIEFLKHQRQYKELFDRYSAGPEDTLERVNATARRVGFDTSDL